MSFDQIAGAPASALGVSLLTAAGQKFVAELPDGIIDASGANAKLAFSLATLLADREEASGTGTGYTLTNTSAAVDFLTTDPAIVLAKTGTYLIIAKARVDHAGATYAANRTVTIKLRRTNNTPADLTNGSAQFQTGIVSTVTQTGAELVIFAIYAGTAADAIALFADVSTVPTAGASVVNQAQILALRLA